MKTTSIVRFILLIVIFLGFQLQVTHASWLSELLDDLAGEGADDISTDPIDEETSTENRIISVIPRIGVVGDSITDEYTTYPYGIGAKNWVQFLEATNKAEIGDFQSLRMYPRLYGFEYNWARAGATTSDLIAEYQHIGLQNQILNGSVEVAVVLIGSNDFREVYGSIYNGTWSDAAKENFLNGLKDRLSVAIDTLYNAGPKMLVISTIPDLGDAAAYRYGNYPNEEKRAAVTRLVENVNEWINGKALENGAIVLDIYHYFKHMTLEPEYRYYGLRVDTTTGGSDASKFFAVDSFHPGSVPQSRLANRLLMLIEDERTRLINQRLIAEAENDPHTIDPVLMSPDYNILTPAEIFSYAGVSPSAEIFFPNSEFTDESHNVIRSPWFGILAIDNYPWINHAEHGWMYCEGYGGTQIQMWDSHLGWLLTSPEDYPLFLRVSDQHLIRYEVGSKQPRRFYDETAGEWLEIDYGAPTKEEDQ